MADRPLRLDAFIPFRLSIASNVVSETIAESYRALFGLAVTEWRVIAVLAEEEGNTQAEVGQRTRMDKVTVSRAAIALAGRGLIERRQSASDRRAQRLALSAKGRELYAAVAPKALELERRILQHFSPGEIETLMTMLRRIEEATIAVRVEEQG